MIGEVFRVFARLGVTSFGGPIAHLGYFRAEFVVRRRWIGEEGYGDLVALAQFLPGPASSQVGFALGWLRAGPLGALVAFLAFTLPSAALLVAVATGAPLLEGPVGRGVLGGLGLVAVAVVAQAVLGMAPTLTPDARRAGIAVVAIALVVLVGGAWGQLAALAAGVVAGLLLCRTPEPETAVEPAPFRIPRALGAACLAVYAVLLAGLPVLAALVRDPVLSLFDAFYRAGALVVGGGHVVLPLLQSAVVDPGWVSRDDFLAGYAAAQAVPGPLFTFAGYLGALASPGPGGVAGAAIALAGIFLPGMLLIVGVLPFWERLRTRPLAQAGMRGAGAAVVGVLGAALYDPVFVTAVTSPLDFVLAVAFFVALVGLRLPPWVVVVVGGLAGAALGMLGA